MMNKLNFLLIFAFIFTSCAQKDENRSIDSSVDLLISLDSSIPLLDLATDDDVLIKPTSPQLKPIASATNTKTDLVMTSFTELKTYHSQCDISRVDICFAAVSRFCKHKGYTSGFGPIEYNRDAARVVCQKGDGGAIKLTTYTTLQSFDERCTGFSTRNSLGCRTSISQYCRSIGFNAGGYGPLESLYDSLQIYCINSDLGQPLEAEYKKLKYIHNACTSSTAVLSGGCQAATSRLCMQKGYITSSPVMETTDTELSFSCLKSAPTPIAIDTRYREAKIETLNLGKTTTAPKKLSLPGCNSVRFAQIPDQKEYALARLLNNTDPNNGCSGTTFNITLTQFNSAKNSFEKIRPIIATPTTVMNGTHKLITAYDPSVIKYGGTYWVAFECHGENIQGQTNQFGTTVGTCVAPFTLDKGFDANRMRVLISGGSIKGTSYKFSGSVPKLFLHQDRPYLYWTAVYMKDGIWQNITTRGSEIVFSNGKAYIKGHYEGPIVSDHPDTVEVWGLKNDVLSDRVADVFDIKSDGRYIYATASLGGGSCLTPTSETSGCYRGVIAKSLYPLKHNSFDIINSSLDQNAIEYLSFFDHPNGDLMLMGAFIQKTSSSDAHDLGVQMVKLSSKSDITLQDRYELRCDPQFQTAPLWNIRGGTCLPTCALLNGNAAYTAQTCHEKAKNNAGASSSNEYCCY